MLTLSFALAAVANNLDLLRARQIKPRAQFRGAGEHHSAEVLNRLLLKSYSDAAVACEDWSLADLRTLQQDLWELRAADLNERYVDQTLADGVTQDRRAIGGDIRQLQARWAALDAADGPTLEELRRDGHCYEAAMWYSHHMPLQAQKALLGRPGARLPLLPQPARHMPAFQDACAGGDAPSETCRVVADQKSCLFCHSDDESTGTKVPVLPPQPGAADTVP